jgi:hypothetical protein
MLRKTYLLLCLALLFPLAQAVPTIQFDLAAYEVDEGDGTAIIIVTISEAPSNVITVNYNTSDGTAEEGKDYTKESGTLRWDLFDDSNKIITVAIIEDTEIEKPDETFTLTLENPTGDATIGDPATTEMTIIDNDDTPDPGTLQFSSATYSVDENDGAAKITVSRVDGSNGVVSVKCISSDGTAKAGEDYTAVSKTLRWSHGEIGNKSFYVGIVDDDKLEGGETFSLELKNPTGGAFIGDPSTAAVTIIDNEVPPEPGFFKFSSDSYEVDENKGTIQIVVKRVDGSDGAVTVDYTSSDGTAKAGEDYTSVSNTLNWKDGDASDKTITIPIIDDNDFENDETFTLNLSNETGGAGLTFPNSTVVTIISEDMPVIPGTLQFSEENYSVSEDGKTVAVPVTRINGSDGQISVECLSSDDTATVSEDYIEVSGRLYWDDGDENDKECIAFINEDSIFEGDETFNLELKNAEGNPESPEIGKPDTAVVTIIDNDQPGTLQFSKKNYSVDEDGVSIDVIVNRVGGKDGAITVDCISSDGTATAVNDYIEFSDTLNWGDQDNGDQTCTVQIINEEDFEDDETFNMTLVNPTSGANIGDPSTAVVTIINDDPPPKRGILQFSSATYNVGESAGTVEITVTRVNGSHGDISVNYATSDDTATAGSDYVQTDGILSWNHGDETEKSFVVNINDDGDFESNEIFNVTLNNAMGGATIGDPDTAAVTIIDNEQPGTLQFSKTDYSVNEDSASINVIVSRIDGKDGAITVGCISSDGSAIAGDDYTGVSNTLNWGNQDDANKICTVPILDDAIFEGDETFNMTLANPTGGAEIGIPNAAKVTIIENEPEPPRGTLQFSPAEYSIAEGRKTISITVTRIDGSYEKASVEYITKDGTAKAGEDYTQTTGTLEWDDGDDEPKTFVVKIIDNDEYENDETFGLVLENPEGAKLGDPNEAVVTILDDEPEPKPGILQFSSATYSVGESNGEVKITVNRVDDSYGAVSVEYESTDGTAAEGSDYIKAKGTLNWDDGDAEAKTFSVEIIDDDEPEGDENFFLRLSNPTGGAELGTPELTMVTISESQLPGTLQFSSATYDVNEGDGTVKITVTRVDGSDGAASVKVVTSNDTAKKNKDYKKTTKTLKWDDGDTSDQTFTVAIIDDDKFEDDETFKLKLKNAKGAKLGNPKQAEVTITDDDSTYEPGTLQFSEAMSSVDEDAGSVTITVSRVGGSDGAISVKCKSSDDTATAWEDYIAVSKTLNWGDGDTGNKTFTVSINNDTEVENNETFSLNLENATGGATTGDPDTTVVTIIDDDSTSEPGTLQFSFATYDVDEGDGYVTITVTRVDGSSGKAAVKVVTSDDSAVKNDDYKKVSKKLKWKDGEAGEKTVTVEIIDDTQPEADETFELKLKKAEGVELGSPKKAEVTIIDDDDGESDVCDKVTEIPFIECKALVAIYESTDGANWDDSSGWNVTETPCDWKGVTCKDGHVLRLYLYSNNLNGEMPPELGNLSGLKRLLLFGNGLSGAIPFELGGLSQLQYLWLQDNHLCGDIPNALMNTAIPASTGYLKLDDNHLITDVSNNLEEWLNARNLDWEDSQTECPAGPNSVQFVQGSYDVNEADGTVTLRVSRIEGDGAISVDYATADGSATEGDDYDGKTDTLNWAENDFADKKIKITIKDDGEFENDETFDVELSNPTGGAILGTPKRAVVTILDAGNLGICNEVTEIDKDECNALIALYDGTNGENWDDNTGWKKTNTPCLWTGVTCDGGHVTRLYFYNNNLEGEIPYDLGNLSELERLLLFNNKLSGVIPPELGDLSQLEYLWLQDNHLCGDIPDTLMNTAIPPNAGFLKLDDNHLITDVSNYLEEWLDARNSGWDESQTNCPVSSVLQFSKSTYSVNENEGTVIINVARIGSSEGEVSVVCATSDESAIAGDDYNELFEVLNWADGDSQDKVCQIDILDDNDLEGDETFIVSLGYPDGAELESLNAVTVTIIDF